VLGVLGVIAVGAVLGALLVELLDRFLQRGR
jgi:hypothetical protein